MMERRLRFEHAAKLLAKSLTDEMLDSIRADYGSTNAGVLRHWRAEVLSTLPIGEERTVGAVDPVGERVAE